MQNQGFDISSSTKTYILRDGGVKWAKKYGYEYIDVRFENWLRENNQMPQKKNWSFLFYLSELFDFLIIVQYISILSL